MTCTCTNGTVTEEQPTSCSADSHLLLILLAPNESSMAFLYMQKKRRVATALLCWWSIIQKTPN